MTGGSGIRREVHYESSERVTSNVMEPTELESLKLSQIEKPNKTREPISSTKLEQVKEAAIASELANTACNLLEHKVPKAEGLIDEFDHVTFWVGNAKHSASFFMSHFGFLPFAFRGLETGSRDLAYHVVRLNDTIIQFASALEPNNEQFGSFLASHGDAVKDVAFRVTNIESLLANAIDAGAELVSPIEICAFGETKTGELDTSKSLTTTESRKWILKRATIKTFGDVTHTFIERNFEYQDGCFLPGYNKPSLEVS